MIRFLRTLGERSVNEFVRDDCGLLSASIAFYVLFSLFPLLIFAVGVTGVFLDDEGTQQDIVDEVLNQIPFDEQAGRSSVEDAVKGVSGPGGGVIGLLGLLGVAWSGSNLFGALRKSLNRIFDDTEFKRPLAQQKLFDLLLVLALTLFFLVSVGATAFLRIVRNNSAELGSLGEFADANSLLWDAASYAVPLVLSFMAFTALFCLVPSRLRSPAEVWPGALVAALLFEVAKLTFSFYLENFTSYDVVFGSLGAAAAFLFWIYVSANLMLFGAEVAAQHRQVPATGYTQPALNGMSLPLHERVWGAVRSLFVAKPAGTRGPVTAKVEPQEGEERRRDEQPAIAKPRVH